MSTSGCDIFFLMGEKKCFILDSFLGGSGSSGVLGGFCSILFKFFAIGAAGAKKEFY